MCTEHASGWRLVEICAGPAETAEAFCGLIGRCLKDTLCKKKKDTEEYVKCVLWGGGKNKGNNICVPAYSCIKQLWKDTLKEVKLVTSNEGTWVDKEHPLYIFLYFNFFNCMNKLSIEILNLKTVKYAVWS